MLSDFSIKPIKAILFDLDGTLVHSSLNFNKIRQDIGCPEGQDVLSYLSTLSDDNRQQAETIIMQHEFDDAHSTQVIEGALCLIERLERAGLKTAVVTRNSKVATNIKIQKTGLKIKHLLTREDAPAKPKPDALLHFSRLWGLSSQECVYVGDYLYDLQAANNAKMHACLFIGNDKTPLPFYAEKADFICRDFHQFEHVLFEYLRGKNECILSD